MSNFVTPTMTPFSLFDATEAFIIEFIGNISEDNKFTKYSMVLRGIDNSVAKEKNNSNIIEITENIEEYLKNNSNITTSSNASMFYYNYNYYLVLPQRYCINGSRYSLEISFINNSGTSYPLDIYMFKCYSSPIIQLEAAKYQDGTSINIEDGVSEFTIQKSFCELNFSYTQNEGDDLKYYQFFLYKKDGDTEQFLGSSKKIYSSTNIIYGVENYNNLQEYVLKLYCITQNNNEKWLTLTFKTDYDQANIYSEITFLLDKENAANNILINISQLNGEGEHYDFTNDEYVMIQHNGYVNFEDIYQTITKNFLCRIWCGNLSLNSPILKLTNRNGDGYIEVFLRDKNFIAYKHSCGLTTAYVSNDLDIEAISTTYHYDIKPYSWVYFETDTVYNITRIDTTKERIYCYIPAFGGEMSIQCSEELFQHDLTNAKTIIMHDDYSFTITETNYDNIYFAIGYYDGRIEMFATTI